MVMNSRNAQNETRPNSTIVHVSPSSNPAARIANIIHQARTRWLKVRSNAGLTALSGWRLNVCPITEATIKTTITTNTSQYVCTLSQPTPWPNPNRGSK